MPTPICRRCGQPLSLVYDGQVEHPLCSPTDTGWIPSDVDSNTARSLTGPVRLAHQLADVGWHVFPLSPSSKRPLANCPACRDGVSGQPHPIEACSCIPAGRWCHGVRAATTDPDRIRAWWTRKPAATPGVAAGPSGLLLIDIDNHGAPPPADLATKLLPGIDLRTENIPAELWNNPDLFRDGRDSLTLLARLRGGTHPWPTDPEFQPVVLATPSGQGRHLWYQAPTGRQLRQALSRHGLAWEVDIKAGWNYGVAPGATTVTGRYNILAGNPVSPGHPPAWLDREIARVASRPPARPAPVLLPNTRGDPGHGPAKYLETVINRRAKKLANLKDGRKLALSALAYQAGGLLAWSGLPHDQVLSDLVDAGLASGLPQRLAHRIASRALTRGIAAPLPGPRAPCRAGPSTHPDEGA